MSDPVPQAHYAKSRPLPTAQALPLSTNISVTTGPSAKLNNVVSSVNGAFGTISMINQNAINHNKKKVVQTRRKIKVLKKVKVTTVKPMQARFGSNTLFSSQNWGSK
jgi:hypothetical protein